MRKPQYTAGKLWESLSPVQLQLWTFQKLQENSILYRTLQQGILLTEQWWLVDCAWDKWANGSLGNHVGSGVATGEGGGGRVPPLTAKKMPKIGKKRKKSGKVRKKEEKSGRKGKNREGSFTLTLLTDRAGYATAHWTTIPSWFLETCPPKGSCL